jgi:hypothetical protein
MGTVQTVVRKLSVVLLTLATVGAGVVLGATRPAAAACSCTAFTDEQALARADAAFIGTVTDFVGPDTQHVYSSSDPVMWTFVVERVFKGDIGATQEVVSVIGSEACGLGLDQNQRYLVFARIEGGGPFEPEPAPGQLAANQCEGTRPAEREEVPPGFPHARQIDDSAGDRASPDPDESSAGSSWPWAATFAVLGGLGAIVGVAVLTVRIATRST